MYHKLMDMTPGATSDEFELQRLHSQAKSSDSLPVHTPHSPPNELDVVQKQEQSNRTKAHTFSHSYKTRRDWDKSSVKAPSCVTFDSTDDLYVKYPNVIDIEKPLGTSSGVREIGNTSSHLSESSSQDLINHSPQSRTKESADQSNHDASPTSGQKSLLPAISLNLEDSDHSNNLSMRYHESESDTLAKKACISQMNQLHRHKVLSYSFKEIAAPNVNPYTPMNVLARNAVPFDAASESSHEPSIVVSQPTVPSSNGRRNYFTLSNSLLFLLVVWAVCSVYFVVYGTSWSFNNHLKTLSASRKQELVEELSLTYAAVFEEKLPLLETTPSPILRGLVYNPPSSNLPECGLRRADVARDLERISTTTTRLKTYGTQCNQASYILDAILDHRFNLTLSLGIWLSADWNSNRDQIATAKSILKKHSLDMIDSIIVGSGVLRNEALDESSLIDYITDIKDFVALNKLSISVGTAESPEYLTTSLVDTCDIVGIRLQPFLSGIPSHEATSWAIKKFEETRKEFDNGHAKFIISEIGWPYEGGTFRQAKASPKEAQIFLDSWVCKQAKEDYYYFEAFDEPWKRIFNTDGNHWESEWGLFSYQRQEKSNLTLPSCN